MNWWQRLFRPRKIERQLENEVLFHLEQHEADLIARGVHPAEARRRARLVDGSRIFLGG